MEKRIAVPVIVFLLTIVAVGTNLDKTFWGYHDWNGARYGNIAENYVDLGYAKTGLGQVENGVVTEGVDLNYYTHYPPLLPLLISFSYHLFGVAEWATRLIPLLATAGLATTIYLIGKNLFDESVGLFSSLAIIGTPMVRYFGKNPVHEPLALFFASLIFLGLIYYRKNKQLGTRLILPATALLFLTNWSGVFLLFALTIFFFKKEKELLKRLWLTGGVIVVLHLLHTHLLTGSFLGGGLGAVFVERTNLGVGPEFNVFGYFDRIRVWSSTHFTYSLLIISIIGGVLAFRREKKDTKTFLYAVILFAVSYPTLFANASFIHSYFIYYWALPLSLLGGYFLYLVTQKTKYAGMIVALVLTVFVWVEKADYLHAIEASSGDKRAVEASTALKGITEKKDIILVDPKSFGISERPFFSFYADRNIVAEESEDYDFVLEIKAEGFEIIRK